MLLKKVYVIPRWKNIKNKIPDITNLADNTTLNAKLNQVKKEISSINNLATTSILTLK